MMNRQLGRLIKDPRISGPTYCLTSCNLVVRALVCRSSGPNPGMSRSESADTRGNPIMLLPSNTFS
jgi:hypothetical protein